MYQLTAFQYWAIIGPCAILALGIAFFIASVVIQFLLRDLPDITNNWKGLFRKWKARGWIRELYDCVELYQKKHLHTDEGRKHIDRLMQSFLQSSMYREIKKDKGE